MKQPNPIAVKGPSLGGRTRRRMVSLGLASTMLSGLAAFAPTLAHADSAPAAPPATPDAAASASTNTGLGEIVVTATHKSESLQKVPISLQAFDNAKLEENHVANFVDYAQMLPSVSFESLGPGRSQPFFRGISVAGGQFSTVGSYLDELPITDSANGGYNSEPEVHIYDVERVEALSGPQGTLFGAGSLAGTLRVITNKPKLDKIEAGIDVTVDKYGPGAGGYMFEGFMNIPLTKNLAVRVMAFDEHEGGYINNTHGTYTYQSVPGITIDNAALVKKNYNPDDEYGGRLALLWEPSPDWKIIPSIIYQRLNSQGAYNFDPRFGDLNVHDYSPTYLIDLWYQAALTITGKIGDFDVVSASGYFHRTFYNANDYTYYSVTYDKLVAAGIDGPTYNHFTDKNGNYINPTQQYYGRTTERKWTQEVRVSTPKEWPVHLTVGAFYQYQRWSIDDNYYIPGVSQAISPDEGFSLAVPGVFEPDTYYLVEFEDHAKDGAGFAEGNVDVTENLKLTGGIRYFLSNNNTYGYDGIWTSADPLVGGMATQSNGTLGCWNTTPGAQYNLFIHPSRLSCINTNEVYAQKGETHKLSAQYQFDPSKMVYATYSTGFRPGGGNQIVGAGPYKADTLINLEIGWKTRWGRNFRWNGAIYTELWKGVQYNLTPAGVQGNNITVNAGNARVKGIESDFEYKPIQALTLSASGSYNNAKLVTNFCDLNQPPNRTLLASCSVLNTYTSVSGVPEISGGDAAALAGTRLPRQPKFKGNVSARYAFDVSNAKSFVEAQIFHQSGSTSNLNEEYDQLLGDTAGFTTFNFSAGAEINKISIEAFIENAFDSRGILSKNSFCEIQYCAQSARSYPVKPQYFGLKIGYKY